jgi:hypothetical protein
LISNIKYVIFIFFTIYFISCTKDKTKAVTVNPIDVTCGDPSFDAEIKSIFLSNCAGCHDNGSPTAGIALGDYNSITLNLDLSIQEIKNGTMPPSGQLDISTINLLDCWIENGSQNN